MPYWELGNGGRWVRVSGGPVEDFRLGSGEAYFYRNRSDALLPWYAQRSYTPL